VKDKTD